jgi:hypothetical protein
LGWFYANLSQGTLLEKIGENLASASRDVEAMKLCRTLRQSSFCSKFGFPPIVIDKESQLLSEWTGRFANAPIVWGGYFGDCQNRFWPTLTKQFNFAKPSGDLMSQPVLAWNALGRAGVTVGAFLDALYTESVPSYNICKKILDQPYDSFAIFTPPDRMDEDLPKVSWQSLSLKKMEVEQAGLVPTDAEKKSAILHKGLNPQWKNLSKERKEMRIADTLESTEIAAKIREQMPQLLPGDTKLSDMKENYGHPWVYLAMALAEWAERKLGRDATTFPVTNVLDAVKEAVNFIQGQATVQELTLYNPSMSPETHAAAWIANSSKFIKPRNLILWIDGPDSTSTTVSAKEANAMFKELMERLPGDWGLRERILEAAREEVPKLPEAERWIVLRPEEILKQLFKTVAAPVGPSPEMTFSMDVDWTAAAFLRDLKIVNPAILDYFQEFEGDNLALMMHIEGATITSDLKEKGATTIQVAKIKDALIKQKLIKP